MRISSKYWVEFFKFQGLNLLRIKNLLWRKINRYETCRLVNLKFPPCLDLSEKERSKIKKYVAMHSDLVVFFVYFFGVVMCVDGGKDHIKTHFLAVGTFVHIQFKYILLARALKLKVGTSKKTPKRNVIIYHSKSNAQWIYLKSINHNKSRFKRWVPFLSIWICFLYRFFMDLQLCLSLLTV